MRDAIAILHAAKLLTSEAQRLWDACVDNRGVGFTCDYCPARGGVKFCRREWQDTVDTANALRALLEKERATHARRKRRP